MNISISTDNIMKISNVLVDRGQSGFLLFHQGQTTKILGCPRKSGSSGHPYPDAFVKWKKKWQTHSTHYLNRQEVIYIGQS